MLSTHYAADAAARDQPQPGGAAPFASPAPSSLGAVSWGAIFAGAAASASLTLILLALGTGLGLSALSPWSHRGASATAFGVAAIAWVTVTQLMASGMGGYIAGRLRTRWAGVPVDEVYFRDTAHGFLSWSVATLATAALLTSVLGSVVDAGAKAGASVAGGAATAVASAATAGTVASGTSGAKADGSGAADPLGYFVDSLFRKADTPTGAAAGRDANADGPAASAEVARIFVNGLQAGSLPPDDAKYVARLVAQRTGLTQVEAEQRVADVQARAQAKAKEAETALRAAADKARKASVQASLWLFISLLLGAFTASLAATLGGRERDS